MSCRLGAGCSGSVRAAFPGGAELGRWAPDCSRGRLPVSCTLAACPAPAPGPAPAAAAPPPAAGPPVPLAPLLPCSRSMLFAWAACAGLPPAAAASPAPSPLACRCGNLLASSGPAPPPDSRCGGPPFPCTCVVGRSAPDLGSGQAAEPAWPSRRSTEPRTPPALPDAAPADSLAHAPARAGGEGLGACCLCAFPEPVAAPPAAAAAFARCSGADAEGCCCCC